MSELLRNAGTGWSDFLDSGKLAALLLAVLLFLWFGRKGKEQGAFLLYTSVMTVLCILPVTAVLLMLYQTRFYDYEWIWSLVPLTAVTAYGITLFLAEYWKGFGRDRWYKGIPVTLLLLAVLLLCGSLGREVWDRDAERKERERAYAVLDRIREEYPDAALHLWAPRDILEYAREKDAGITLLYGRNMWDPSLNAYAYDVYDENVVMAYRWMEWTQLTGEGSLEVKPEERQDSEDTKEAVPADRADGEEPFSGPQIFTSEDSAAVALTNGVNCILLPEISKQDTVRSMERALGVQAGQTEGYYLFMGPFLPTSDTAEDRESH